MSKLLIVRTKGQLFGIPVTEVGEILPLRETLDVPSSGPLMSGAVNVRGHVLPLFDLRKLLGWPFLIDERQALVQSLTQREQDHIDWLEALEKSARDGSEFRKAIDPRGCAFGKWYYSFVPPDPAIGRILSQFEQPHAEIHGLATNVLAASSAGHKDQSLKMIDTARRGTLAGLLRLFSELKTELVSNLRNLFLVLRTPDGFDYALAVDGVETVRDLANEGLNVREDGGTSPLISAMWSNKTSTICEVSPRELHALVRRNQGAAPLVELAAP